MYEGGLNRFLINTVQDYAILAGTCSSFGVSVIVCILVSLCTHKVKTVDDANMEWQKMYDIDNPLNPWELNYREELEGLVYDDKPTFDQMASTFRKAKLTAYIGGSISIIVFAIIIPSIMASFSVMSKTQFNVWVWFTQIWAVVMAVIVIVAPPFEEISRIIKQCKVNRSKQREANGLMEERNEIMLKTNDSMTSNQPVTKV